MPEVCPHCGTPIVSERRSGDGDRDREFWRCEECEEEWRHPEETVMNRGLDFSAAESAESPDPDTTTSGW
jgi:ribosomal protein L37AE/L43A